MYIINLLIHLFNSLNTIIDCVNSSIDVDKVKVLQEN